MCLIQVWVNSISSVLPLIQFYSVSAISEFSRPNSCTYGEFCDELTVYKLVSQELTLQLEEESL